MAKIFWDTNLFIYLLENHPQHASRVVAMRNTMNARGDQLLTTSMTVGEILVKPVAEGRADLEQRYIEFFRSGAVEVLPFTIEAATRFARIRQDRAIKPPDAIQLACAAAEGIDLFITNDDRLSEKVVAGVNFISSLERAPI